MKNMIAILTLVSLSMAAQAATIECAPPWVGGYGNNKASLSFNLGSNGLPRLNDITIQFSCWFNSNEL